MKDQPDSASEDAPTSGVLIQTRMCPTELARAEWRFGDFRVHKLLGEGAMSTVVHCTCQLTGLPVAIKMYHKDRLNRMNVKQVAREIDIHASLDHPNVVKLYAAFEDGDGIYLVQEYASQGTPAKPGDLYHALSQAGGYMTEQYVADNVIRPLLSALEHMHSVGVLHRDIKPENVMLGDDGGLRLGDFGLAINTSREQPMSRVGTLDYMAPEIVKITSSGQKPAPAAGTSTREAPTRLPDEPAYGLPVDMWCVGVLAYELLVGGPPFEAPSKDATYLRIIKAEPWMPSHLSSPARDLVLMLLRKDPQQRPAVKHLQQHAWLRQSQPEGLGAEGSVCAADNGAGELDSGRHRDRAANAEPGSRLEPSDAACSVGSSACSQQQDGMVLITLGATGAGSAPVRPGAGAEGLIRASHGPGHPDSSVMLPPLGGAAAKMAAVPAAAPQQQLPPASARRSRTSSLLRALHLGPFGRKSNLEGNNGTSDPPTPRSSRLAAGTSHLSSLPPSSRPPQV